MLTIHESVINPNASLCLMLLSDLIIPIAFLIDYQLEIKINNESRDQIKHKNKSLVDTRGDKSLKL